MARTAQIRVPGLSKRAAKFLQQHPREAQQAITAALEAVATVKDSEGPESPSAVPERLRPFVVGKPRDPSIVGVSEAARQLGVSRTTIYEWVRKGVLLGWSGTRRGLNIPSEQILGAGEVVPGIAEVLDIIEDPKLAWIFLSEEWPFKYDPSRPIDKLKSGKVDEVVHTAPGFGTVFS